MLLNVTTKFLNSIRLPDKYGKQLNYLIVVPRIAVNSESQYQFPIGIGMVSSALKASGRNVFTLNLNYKTNPVDVLSRAIMELNIDVVATGGLSEQYAVIKEVCDTAKKTNTKIVNIVGGG